MHGPEEILGWIQREHGFSSPSEWVRLMANRFHTESSQTSPPVVLEKILRNKNIDVQFVSDLAVDGRLVCKERGFTVLLNDKLRVYKARARFTTAHELGHTLFYDWSSVTPRRAVPRYFNNPCEELICNAFAGELLMPFEYLLREGRAFPEKSEPEKALVLQQVATRCAVARQVAACHLVRTLGWWDSILIFTAQAGKQGTRDTTDLARRIIWSWYPPRLDGKLYIPGNRSAYPKIKIPELQRAAESA